jgi:transcription factor YY
MASSEVSEVLYCEEDLSMGGLGAGLDMPVECVQEVVTDSAFHLEGDAQIIYGDELIVTAEDVPQSEEIVGGSCIPDDPIVGLYDGVPVPSELDAHVELRKFVRKPPSHHHHHHNHHRSSSGSGSNRTIMKCKTETFFDEYETKFRSHHGTWQQKQVSIKTLEGEFSVTMWASGADDGKNINFFVPLSWQVSLTPVPYITWLG